MKKTFGLISLSLLAAALQASPSDAAECAFSKWMDFKGTEIFRQNVAKAYNYRNNVSVAKAYYYETREAVVDADGAPNAYHPDDVGKDCEKDDHTGLDCLANAGYPDSDWWSDVLAPDPDHPTQAYVQKNGPFKGFFVAMTWLTAEGSVTDPGNYVDSTKIPYLVFPGAEFQKMSGTGDKGDVGVAWNLKNGLSVSFIVADLAGKEDRLGEASIALFEDLGGEDVNARDGSGIAPGLMRFIVFPGSRKLLNQPWPRTNSEIDEQARHLLSEIGGEAVFDGCK